VHKERTAIATFSSSSNTSHKDNATMTRSFSLAPGGWVGSTPGRSGDTSIPDLESESKLFLHPLHHIHQGSCFDHLFFLEAYQEIGKQRIEKEKNGNSLSVLHFRDSILTKT
jgi:hypothetical protein